MLGTYTYNEIFRKSVVAFGTLFNNIEIRRKVDATNYEYMKVPLAYGPKQKFLARLRQVGDLSSQDATQITLPRISFEIASFQYDSTRKVSPTQVVRTAVGSDMQKAFMPVPYNVDFELAILAKNQDDGLQILEQILPYFQPSFNITVQLQDQLQEKKDFPVTLNAITYEDDYEGDYNTRRTLIYSLSFTCKTYLYGPVTDGEDTLIRKAIVDMAPDSKPTAAREMRYTVEPDPITADPDDNFGFNELFSEFNDGKSRNATTGQDE